MDQVKFYLSKVFSRPKRIVLFMLVSFVFLILLFPFSDLSDLVSAQVSKVTNNSVYLQFEDLSFSIFPAVGLKISDIVVESAQAPEIEVGSLTISPSFIGLLNLIKGKPAGYLGAREILNGEVDVWLKPSKVIKDDNALNIQLEASALDLKKLLKVLNKTSPLPFTARGLASANARLDVLPSGKVQPEGLFNLNLHKPEIPAFSVKSSFGELPLPSFQFSKILTQAELKGGRLTLKKASLGEPKDPMYGNITGQIDISVMPGMRINYGLYDFNVDLTLKKDFKSQLGAMTAFIQQFESKTLTGSRFRFRAQGRVGTPPRLTAL